MQDPMLFGQTFERHVPIEEHLQGSASPDILGQPQVFASRKLPGHDPCFAQTSKREQQGPAGTGLRHERDVSHRERARRYLREEAMTTEIEYRHQVEGWVGRALTDEEIVVVCSIEELSAAQKAILDLLARRNRLGAVLYLRGVTEGLLYNEALAIVDGIRDTPAR